MSELNKGTIFIPFFRTPLLILALIVVAMLVVGILIPTPADKKNQKVQDSLNKARARENRHNLTQNKTKTQNIPKSKLQIMTS